MRASKCFFCGEPVPRHGKTAHPALQGRPNVSLSMLRIDPKGYFCTMRCAARYGVLARKNLSEDSADG